MARWLPPGQFILDHDCSSCVFLNRSKLWRGLKTLSVPNATQLGNSNRSILWTPSPFYGRFNFVRSWTFVQFKALVQSEADVTNEFRRVNCTTSELRSYLQNTLFHIVHTVVLPRLPQWKNSFLLADIGRIAIQILKLKIDPHAVVKRQVPSVGRYTCSDTLALIQFMNCISSTLCSAGAAALSAEKRGSTRSTTTVWL
jgi:hypothetical protein